MTAGGDGPQAPSEVPEGDGSREGSTAQGVQEAVEDRDTLEEAAARITEVRDVGDARPERTGPDGEPLGGDAG